MAIDTEPQVVDDERTTTASGYWWSPAQIVSLIGGICFVILGAVAVARTGFDTDHIYTPHDVVWHLPHSPLLGAIEIGFGVLLILAGVFPGGLRPLIAILGAAALVFGIVVLVNAWSDNLNHWLAATHRTGWLFTIAGAVLLVFALFSPSFYMGGTRHRAVRHEVVS